MHVRIGCPPNLPWWRLQNMTDKEVWAYNERFMIEETTEMTDDNLDDVQPKKTVVRKMNEIEHNKVWNAAIEAAAKIADDGDEYSAEQIRKLKK